MCQQFLAQLLALHLRGAHETHTRVVCSLQNEAKVMKVLDKSVIIINAILTLPRSENINESNNLYIAQIQERR